MTLETLGEGIRALAKTLVLEFMHTTYKCQPGNEGITQARIFRSVVLIGVITL